MALPFVATIKPREGFMRLGRVRLMFAVAVISAGAFVSAGAASAAPGTGTFTHISTPSKDLMFHYTIGVTNSFQVSGQTSLDVTSVDIDCVLFVHGQEPLVTTLHSGVSVTNGQFSTTATSSSPPTNCRLRAIPTGVDVAGGDYIGSYTGPILYTEALGLTTDGTTQYAFAAYVEEGDGLALLNDAGSCGSDALVTVEAPQMLAGPLVISCAFSLPPANLDPSGAATRSAIQVDGRNAYLPAGVHNFLITDRGLAVTQSALSVSRHIASNGDTAITESATLMRCSNTNLYPPTTVSCPSLVSTGVRFTRVSTVFRNGHQVKVRDSFTSIDHHAHTSTLQYASAAVNQTSSGTATGNVGYTYPGHTSTFHPANLGQSVTGLGSKAATMFIRSDLRARSDDPTADTLAESWSRGPSKIFYSATSGDQFSLAYSLAVPSGGQGFLGFAISERWSTSDVNPLASAAVADMMSAPSITSPTNGARVHGKKTRVQGKLVAGANGLPTSVKVNGHKATITKHSSTSASYSVKFREAIGRHKITVTATDVGGNARTASIRIRNS
jgi:hypothetical protein